MNGLQGGQNLYGNTDSIISSPKTQHSKNEDPGIWSYHFMANRWGESGNSVRLHFLFMVSKINADIDCSHEIKRFLFPGRKAMTNLDSVLKSRDITLRTKVHLVKAVIFPAVMYGCEELDHKESGTPKN